MMMVVARARPEAIPQWTRPKDSGMLKRSRAIGRRVKVYKPMQTRKARRMYLLEVKPNSAMVRFLDRAGKT